MYISLTKCLSSPTNLKSFNKQSLPKKLGRKFVNLGTKGIIIGLPFSKHKYIIILSIAPNLPSTDFLINSIKSGILSQFLE